MSHQTITVTLRGLTEPTETLLIDIDNEYKVLDFILLLKSYKNMYGSYSLKLPVSGLISPGNVMDKLMPQVVDKKLDVIIFNPITYRNSFNVINNLIGLHDHNLLGTNNIMDVEPINHGKPGEWIGWGSGPITVPSEEDNRLHNLLWVIYNTEKPVVYNLHCLREMFIRDNEQVLIPHLNKKIKPDKFAIACLSNEKFKILRINGNDILHS
jgi:hypothetical protein